MRPFLTLTALVVALSGLAACGDDKKGGGSSGAGGPDIGKPGEGQLDMVIWEGYADPSFVKGFEQQSGCKVNAVPAGSSDEMYTKFRSGGGGQYDLVSPSGDASLRLIKSGAVAPLDTSKLTNFKSLAPQLQSPDFNTVDAKNYGISFMWGADVLIYNADKITTAPDSWAILYDPRYKGKITVPDNPIQIADPALQFFGAANPFAIDQATLDKVKAKLLSQRKLVRKYWVLASDFEQLFKSGDAVVGAGWPLMTNDLRKAGLNVVEVLPKEGVTGWSDSWMISTKARHPICAYKYMNYVTSPKVQAKVADVTAYSPANTKTCAVVGPARCKALHITDSRYYDTIKYWQTPTAPTNYRQWTDAWAEVRG
ncbi:MAG: putative spermidine/putrescine transport system substrate-binding protein [Solirubrobacteraceae bacterium]|nr:putative spermidine/putrescine transport system substrate-binding protein [Solirubrobacteraceae bacterium]